MKLSKSLCLTVVASLSLRAMSSAQLAPIELRIVTAETFDLETGVGAGDSTSDSTALRPDAIGHVLQTMYVQARADGVQPYDIVTFDARLVDDATGTFGPAPLTNTEALGVQLPGLDVLGRAGLFPTFRAGVGLDNEGSGNGVIDPKTGRWSFDPLNLAPRTCDISVCPLGEWIDVYRFDWSSEDVSTRIVLLEVGATSGAYSTSAGLQNPVPVTAGSFRLVILGVCPCEVDGAAGVTVSDLLEYLALWFAGDASSELDGVSGVSIFDLLDYLSCWIPASGGTECSD